MTQVPIPSRYATPTGRDAAVAPQHRLLQHIDSRLDEPDLDPGAAASALGWSLRRVHAVMRDAGSTFMAYVSRRRLDQARTLLTQGPAPVAEVAFGCGFNSLSIFYRQYVAAFTETPAATRQRALSSPGVGTSATRAARTEKSVQRRPPIISPCKSEPMP